ncbi:hypothetical protein [Streptomyces sp. ISL-43]|nr:hypothetical protein [Streptomyces sp. ISL-43]
MPRTGCGGSCLETGDAHGVYAKVGFASLAIPEDWMLLGEQ